MGLKFLLMLISHLNHSEEEEEEITRWEEIQGMEMQELELELEQEQEERSFVLIVLSRMRLEVDRIVRFVDYPSLDRDTTTKLC